MSDVGKLIELAAFALWDPEHDLLGLYEGLHSLGMCTHDLRVVGLHLLQDLLVVLLGMFLRNLGMTILNSTSIYLMNEQLGQ